MMKPLTYCLLMFGSVALFTGCVDLNAKGPGHAEVSKALPPVEQDHGRIFIYRRFVRVLGGPAMPAVKLNEEMIGKAMVQGFFYVDRPAGQYAISTATEVKRKLSFLLDKGQTRYVRLHDSSGFWEEHIYPELIEPAQAEAEIKACIFTGVVLKRD